MSFKVNQTYWPAEWAPQKAVILVWPHHTHDWANNMERVQASYVQMCHAITQHQELIIVCNDEAHWSDIEPQLKSLSPKFKIYPIMIPTNDTWVRDTGPMTIHKDGRPVLLDFEFNAWGSKYDFSLDNQVPSNLSQNKYFTEYNYLKHDFILEGGSIESDGQGTLLTTKSCLLNPNRNPKMKLNEVEKYLKASLGVEQILWLEATPLPGDDTDGHIDTLARFCPNNTIVYLEVDNLKEQLQDFTNTKHKPYTLVSLPFKAIKNEQGEPLASSYANFLIINQGLLVPQYGIPEDAVALERLGACFEGYTLYPIDAKCFVEQGGSVHCLTMQVPI